MKKILFYIVLFVFAGCQSNLLREEPYSSEFRSNVLNVRSKIENNWAVPVSKTDLTSTVVVELDESARVVDSTIHISSGSELFDKSLVDAVYKSSPFRELRLLSSKERQKFNKFLLTFSKEASFSSTRNIESVVINPPRNVRSIKKLNETLEQHYVGIYDIYRRSLMSKEYLGGAIAFMIKIKPNGEVQECSTTNKINARLSDLGEKICKYIESVDFGEEDVQITLFKFPIEFMPKM